MSSEDERARWDDAVICPSCAGRNPSRARFCMDCGARVIVETGERRLVSVLFADLSGFTSYSESVDPEAVRAVAEAAARRFGEIVVRHGGVVDKVIGDCVMATFGTPVPKQDDAERAVRAALAMQAEASAHAADFAGLKVSIGVSTGEAIYAPVGPSGEYTVLGDTVNAAARLQSAADRGQVFIGEATRSAVAGSIETAEMPAIDVPGSDEPLRAWLAMGEVGTGVRPRPSAPFVGRRAELVRLRELWERVTTENSAYLLTVIGPAGVGKRRLIDSFAETAGARTRVLWGSCLPYADGATYWPITEILRGAARISHDDDPAEVSAKLGALLEDLAVDDVDELRTIAVAVAHLLAAPRTPRGTYEVRDVSRGELHWGIRRLFELLSAREPVVVVIEDAHAAEPPLVDLLDSFARSPNPAGILFVALARSDVDGPAARMLTPGQRRRTMRLQPLPDEDARAMLAALTGRDGWEHVPDEAAGSPLWLEEAALLGDPSFAGDLAALIRARLARLPESTRTTLRAAAGIGVVFWDGALAEVLGATPELEEALAAHLIVARATSSVAGEREYAFAHPTIAERAAGDMPLDGGAHARLARWIERLPGGREAYAELIAHHLAASASSRGATEEVIRDAVAALERAAERADAHDGTSEARGFRHRALELLGDRDRAAALAIAIRIAESGGESRPAAADEADALGRPDLACRVLLATAPADPSALERARAAAERAGDDALMLAVMVRAAERRAAAGEPGEARRELEAALALAGARGDAEAAIVCETALGELALHQGETAEAARRFRRCAGEARRLGRIRWAIVAGTGLAETLTYTGPAGEALETARAVTRWLERDPDPRIALRIAVALASIAESRGDLPAAERALTDAIEEARREGHAVGGRPQALLSIVLSRMGRARTAARVAADARAALASEDALGDGWLSLAEAVVAAGDGRGAQARAALERASAALAGAGPLERAEAWLAATLVHEGNGDRAAARGCRDRAAALLTAAGARVRAGEIRERQPA